MNTEQVMREVRDRLNDGRITREQFDMRVVWNGSVGCIGGWALHILCGERYASVDLYGDMMAFLSTRCEIEGVRCPALYDLFFRWSLANPTPADAVQAIDAWLGGCRDNPWSHVLR